MSSRRPMSGRSGIEGTPRTPDNDGEGGTGNPLFDAIKEYMDARDAVKGSVGASLDRALARASTAEVNLRKVCAGVCRVDGGGLPGSTPPDNDRT